MSQNTRRLGDDESATVGIGTMIVFIATVLVAAIAAGVLIQTSSDLQQKSSETGKEATQQVASNLALAQLLGMRDAVTDAGLQDLHLYVTLAPGAIDIDLSEARIFIQNGTEQVILDYTSGTADADSFSASVVRDADGSFTFDHPSMTPGDLIVIEIDLNLADLELEPRDSFDIRIIPEVGESVQRGVRTSGSYGNNLVIQL